MSKTVVILGAGPAALSAGLELNEKGFKTVLIEREDRIGGISKTIQYKGYRFDVGGHRFFTKSKEVNKLWKDTLGKDFVTTPRLSRIYYNRKFFMYPVEVKDTLSKAGVWTSITCVASYIKYKIFPIKPEKSFEDWVSNRFGRKLFNMFFKSYTEKVWGISTKKLSAEWATQRIKNLSMWEAIKNAIFKPKDKVTSLIDEFHYPKYGPGMMYEKMAELLKKSGTKIMLSANVLSFKKKGNRIEEVIIEKNGQKQSIKGDYFISTIPLPDTIRFITPKIKELQNINKDLKFRDFLSVNLILKKSELFPDTWIYVHDPSVKMGRIQNYKNWSRFMSADNNHTPIGCEYFCNQGDSLWNTDDKKLIALATAELEKIGLAKKEDVTDGLVYRMRDAYPVYMGEYHKAISKARKVIESIANLEVAGRGGMFRYNNMDHSILAGLFAARKIAGESYDPWDVNEEDDYHETIKSDKK